MKILLLTIRILGYLFAAVICGYLLYTLLGVL